MLFAIGWSTGESSLIALRLSGMDQTNQSPRIRPRRTGRRIGASNSFEQSNSSLYGAPVAFYGGSFCFYPSHNSLIRKAPMKPQRGVTHAFIILLLAFPVFTQPGNSEENPSPEKRLQEVSKRDSTKVLGWTPNIIA